MSRRVFWRKYMLGWLVAFSLSSSIFYLLKDFFANLTQQQFLVGAASCASGYLLIVILIIAINLGIERKGCLFYNDGTLFEYLQDPPRPTMGGILAGILFSLPVFMFSTLG